MTPGPQPGCSGLATAPPTYAPLVDTVAERFNDFNGDGCPDAVVEVGGGLCIYFGGRARCHRR